jgi:hypothetical protein
VSDDQSLREAQRRTLQDWEEAADDLRYASADLFQRSLYGNSAIEAYDRHEVIVEANLKLRSHSSDAEPYEVRAEFERYSDQVVGPRPEAPPNRRKVVKA